MQKLTEKDFKRIAKTVGCKVAVSCKVAAIKAVAAVESRGAGFYANGEPKILFEAHIFSRLTNGIYNIEYPDISSPKWDKSLYKKGKVYDRLGLAISLDKEAALKSTSWGKFQIMGFNYKLCGYNSVQDFVNDMYVGEIKHLEAFIHFCISNNLIKHLINKEWAQFAYKYNGPGYKKNRYDKKLAAAYAKFSKS